MALTRTAVVLAGGRSARLGRDKALVQLDGRTLLDRTLDAVQPLPVVLVGPERAITSPVTLVREHPPFSGPLAALAAALEVVHTREILLLSCDLVDPASVCGALAGIHLAPGEDGAHLVDAAGRAQWLAGVYRVAALTLPDPVADAPLRRAFAGLRLRAVPGEAADIDTPDDLERTIRGAARRSPPD